MLTMHWEELQALLEWWLYLYGHMQEVSVIQAGLHRAVLVAAAADVRVRRAHDEELVEVTLGKELKQQADGLLLGHHAQQAHHVGVLQIGQHGRLLCEEKKDTERKISRERKCDASCTLDDYRPDSRCQFEACVIFMILLM